MAGNDDIIGHVRMPPDEYALGYRSHKTTPYGSGYRIDITFVILTDGEHYGKEVHCHRGVEMVTHGGKTRIKLKKTGKFVNELCLLLDGLIDCSTIRLDRPPLDKLKGIIVLGRIETCTRTSERVERAEATQYEVVTALIRRLDQTDTTT